MKRVKILRKQIAPQAIKDEVLRTAIHCTGRILNEDGADSEIRIALKDYLE